MDKNVLNEVVAKENEVLQSLDGTDHTEASFVCPICAGTAHLTLHEWRGYASYCENGCFSV